MIFKETLPSDKFTQRITEDPLEYLPCSTIQQFANGERIYDQTRTAEAFYLVLDGKVKVSRTSESASRSVLVDIYQEHEFFGESAFIGSRHMESATALGPVKLMSWTVDQINHISTDRPKLGVALLQFIVKRSQAFEARLESLAVDGIQRRLARTLHQFAERLGEPTGDGRITMDSLTHQLLSEYVGTSREIITHFLNEFRNKGYVQYSRRTTVVDTAGLTAWLGQ
jgi:CRP/FNR family transcriptional regulator